jgi:hypothetical protein
MNRMKWTEKKRHYITSQSWMWAVLDSIESCMFTSRSRQATYTAIRSLSLSTIGRSLSDRSNIVVVFVDLLLNFVERWSVVGGSTLSFPRRRRFLSHFVDLRLQRVDFTRRKRYCVNTTICLSGTARQSSFTNWITQEWLANCDACRRNVLTLLFSKRS